MSVARMMKSVDGLPGIAGQPAFLIEDDIMTATPAPRRSRVAALAAALALGLVASGSALAWHHGPRVGIYVGPGYYYPPWYYYPPAPVVVPAQPPVYIERAPETVPAPAPAPSTGQAQPQAYYFCAASNAYYPYVRECAGGWQVVAPQPPR